VEDSTSPDSTPFIVTASGAVGIGTASPTGALNVVGDELRVGSGGPNSDATGAGELYVQGDLEADGQFYLDGVTADLAGASQHVCIDTSSRQVSFATGNTCFDLSDASVKTNVVTLSSSLDKVLNLRGVNFEWIDPAMGTGTQLGFIAQEVEPVVPEAVTTREGGLKGVKYDKLTAVLAEAIKELNWKVDDLATSSPEIPEGSFTSRFFTSLFTHITAWLADAANGIGDIFASVGNFGRVNTEELCVDDVCVTRDQFAEVFGNQSAAAGAPTVGGSSEAPSGPPAREATPVTGTTTTTTSTHSSTPVATGTSPVPEQPPPVNADQSVSDELAEEGGDNQEPAPDLITPEPANDNALPSETTDATGTDGQ